MYNYTKHCLLYHLPHVTEFSTQFLMNGNYDIFLLNLRITNKSSNHAQLVP